MPQMNLHPPVSSPLPHRPWLLKCACLWLGLASFVSAAPPEVTWREIITVLEPRAGLLGDPAAFAEIVPPRATPVEGIRSYTEALADMMETFDRLPETHYFFCTVYYTPRESGFTKAGGYNTAPTKPR